MNYPDIHIEGGLLSPDFLEGVHDAPGQRPADFGLPRRVSLVDEVTAAWGDALAYWRAFNPVSYTHLRAHEPVLDHVCRLLLAHTPPPPPPTPPPPPPPPPNPHPPPTHHTPP